MVLRPYRPSLMHVLTVHTLGMTPKDLKPQKLLLDHNKNVKITDFGRSYIFREGQLPKTARGFSGFAPPEFIWPHLPAPDCDVWSAGVALFELVRGCLPLKGTPGFLGGPPQFSGE